MKQERHDFKASDITCHLQRGQPIQVDGVKIGHVISKLLGNLRVAFGAGQVKSGIAPLVLQAEKKIGTTFDFA